MSFIKKDFMLNNETAKKLYHEYAENLPIFDYHCHLSPEEIAHDHEFKDITELWLSGDHYKWRGMRAYGIPESEITGTASSKEKFRAWAETSEESVGNPLFHWTQLELKRYFDIDDLLSSDNWEDMYSAINQKLKLNHLSARTLIKRSNVQFIGTTDSPFDSLNYHEEIAKDTTFNVTVVPAFRPDELFNVNSSIIKKLESVCEKTANKYADFIQLVEERVVYFDQHGSMISDHGISELVYREVNTQEIEEIYSKVRSDQVLNSIEQQKWVSRLLIDLAGMYTKRNWVMQIHLGALRNNNDQILNSIGTDAGADSIGDQPYFAKNLNAILDAMHKQQKLPKTILYNLNPIYNHIVASTVANFQGNEKGIKSKIQFGSGWWFNDTEKGILRQLQTLADHGFLMHFVGMITDSRSFTSYTRHEYFRRILCNFIGEQVELGKFPNNERILKKMVEGICYYNAKKYFSR